MKKIVNIPCYSYEFVEGWLDITSTINQSIVFMGHKIFSDLATHYLYYFFVLDIKHVSALQALYLDGCGCCAAEGGHSAVTRLQPREGEVGGEAGDERHGLGQHVAGDLDTRDG